MKDVVLITNYWHFERERAGVRYLTLVEMIPYEIINLEVITSTFYHASKEQRNYDKKFLKSFPYKITLIPEPGYRRNVDIKRIISHKVFARNVIQYLKKRKKPDVIYIAVPQLDSAYAVSRYAKKNNIPIIIDVRDLWPEAFEMAFSVQFLSRLLFASWQMKANAVYRLADGVVAVSQTYVDRVMRVNKICKNPFPVFQGIDLFGFDKGVSEHPYNDKPQNEIWIAYVGTLGHSYDIPCVIDALRILKDRGIENLRFVVMGRGPLMEEFEKRANKSGILYTFTGNMQFGQMAGMLVACDIAVNPIVKSATQSIIQKHGDYAAAGLPIINSQKCTEYRNLIEEYKCGFNCENNNPSDMANKILVLLNDTSLKSEMGKNSRKLAEEKFDRTKTYQKIIDLILQF